MKCPQCEEESTFTVYYHRVCFAHAPLFEAAKPDDGGFRYGIDFKRERVEKTIKANPNNAKKIVDVECDNCGESLPKRMFKDVSHEFDFEGKDQS